MTPNHDTNYTSPPLCSMRIGSITKIQEHFN